MSQPNYRSNAMLAAMARGQLLGKYPFAAAVFMFVLLMYMTTQLFFAGFLVGGGIIGFITSLLASFIVSLLYGVVNVGVLLMALKLCCREPLLMGDLFYGFHNQPNRIVAVQAVFAAAILLVTLPASILLNAYYSTNEADYLPLVLVLFLAGLAVYFYISLALSQVFFLLLDFADKGAGELLSMAYLIMNGHKKRLFFLWLGFAPLILLAIFSCGLGFLWVAPFIKVTQANFYMDLMQNRYDKEAK
ncbi:MAG: DUF975 family protein [Lachnospiraceae bacterium]|jgi:uncharacterized membrane protein|nr:DUF975 family protein [Lachnospiraceae bacterium]